MLHLLLAFVIVTTASADSASLGCYSYGSGECLHLAANIGYVGEGQMACAQACYNRDPTYKAAATLYSTACLCLTDYPTCTPLSYPKCVNPPTSTCLGDPTCVLDAYNISAVISSSPVVRADWSDCNGQSIYSDFTPGEALAYQGAQYYIYCDFDKNVWSLQLSGNGVNYYYDLPLNSCTDFGIVNCKEVGNIAPVAPPVILANDTANMGCYHYLDGCISIQSNIGYIGAGTGDKDYAQKCAQACVERVPNTQYAGLLYPSACLCMQNKPTCAPFANICPIQDVQCFGSESCQVGVYDTKKLLESAPVISADWSECNGQSIYSDFTPGEALAYQGAQYYIYCDFDKNVWSLQLGGNGGVNFYYDLPLNSCTQFGVVNCKQEASKASSESSVWKKYALTSPPIISLVAVLAVLALVAVGFAIYKCKRSADSHMKLKEEEEAEKQMGVEEELEKMQQELEKQEKSRTSISISEKTNSTDSVETTSPTSTTDTTDTPSAVITTTTTTTTTTHESTDS